MVGAMSSLGFPDAGRRAVAVIGWWLAALIVPAPDGQRLVPRAHCDEAGSATCARAAARSDQMIARLEAAGGTSNIVVIIVAVFAHRRRHRHPRRDRVAGLPDLRRSKAKVARGDAVIGNEVASAVGQALRADRHPARRQRHRTRACCSSTHHSQVVTRRLAGRHERHRSRSRSPPAAAPTVSIKLVPSTDGNRHMTWTCTTLRQCSASSPRAVVPRSLRARRRRRESGEKHGLFDGGDDHVARATGEEPPSKRPRLSPFAAGGFCRADSSDDGHAHRAQELAGHASCTAVAAASLGVDVRHAHGDAVRRQRAGMADAEERRRRLEPDFGNARISAMSVPGPSVGRRCPRGSSQLVSTCIA